MIFNKIDAYNYRSRGEFDFEEEKPGECVAGAP